MVQLEVRYRLLQNFLKQLPEDQKLYKGNFGAALWKARSKRNGIHSLLEHIDKNHAQMDFSQFLQTFERELKKLPLYDKIDKIGASRFRTKCSKEYCMETFRQRENQGRLVYFAKTMEDWCDIISGKVVPSMGTCTCGSPLINITKFEKDSFLRQRIAIIVLEDNQNRFRTRYQNGKIEINVDSVLLKSSNVNRKDQTWFQDCGSIPKSTFKVTLENGGVELSNYVGYTAIVSIHERIEESTQLYELPLAIREPQQLDGAQLIAREPSKLENVKLEDLLESKLNLKKEILKQLLEMNVDLNSVSDNTLRGPLFHDVRKLCSQYEDLKIQIRTLYPVK